MRHIKTKGFVIRVNPFGEADRLVSILTPEQGLVRAFAKGARRQRSPLRLGTQDFVLGTYELFQYKDRQQIDSAEIIEPFLALQSDMNRLVCAAHLAEVLYDASEFDQQQPQLYTLCGYSFQALQAMDDPVLAVHVAQMRVLSLLGLAPRLDACVICGRFFQEQNPVQNKTDTRSYSVSEKDTRQAESKTEKIEKAASESEYPEKTVSGGNSGQTATFFSVRICGAVCAQPACRRQAPDLIHLTEGTAACLRHSLAAPYGRLFNFSVKPAVRQAFIDLSQAYLVHQMEKSYPRLNMLGDLLAFSENPDKQQ